MYLLSASCDMLWQPSAGIHKHLQDKGYNTQTKAEAGNWNQRNVFHVASHSVYARKNCPTFWESSSLALLPRARWEDWYLSNVCILIIERKLYIRVVVQSLYAMLLAVTRVGCQPSHLLLKANEQIFSSCWPFPFLFFFQILPVFWIKPWNSPNVKHNFQSSSGNC